MRITRRKFLKTSAFAGIGSAVGTGAIASAPSILTTRRAVRPEEGGMLVFRPSSHPLMLR